MKRPIVHLYTACWNEADMLGFFFRHYDPWVDRYVIYDDGSTDGSRTILEAHPRVELRTLGRSVEGSLCLSHLEMQNQTWKESRGQAEWVVITAIDEHLHHPSMPMDSYLAEQGALGVTLIPALGFEMNHPEMPDDEGLLVRHVVRGRSRSAFNKLSLFRPEALNETGFGPGRHAAVPDGTLCLPRRDAIMLWHYKHLGFERNAARDAEQATRLEPVDRAEGLGQHYLWGSVKLRAFWDEMEEQSKDLSTRDFDAAAEAARPLWWDERADVSRVLRECPTYAEPRRDPVVSVLVKSYNHAPFVRQTIDSILGQSVQDFEIVVTDDGSTDGTAEILRTYDDPRIKLDLQPRNIGIPAAMNATIERARGEYLAILNSDDYALPGRLARQIAFLETNPDVTAVFGLPTPIDEDNNPTSSYNDFRDPLSLPDFSRRSWLRTFFFNGNCLCAPTAMIRRNAFVTLGNYELRLQNLHDFDMWVRLAIHGSGLHVLDEPLTALRIRRNNANASAPSWATNVRSAFEILQVLRRYTLLDGDDLTDIFGSASSERKIRLFDLAKLALGVGTPAHSMFGMQLLYDHATEMGDLDELKSLSGSTDIFSIETVAEQQRLTKFLSKSLADLQRCLQEIRQNVAGRQLPAPGFDEAYYLAHNADVAHAVSENAFESGYHHWACHGANEQRKYRLT